MPIPSPVIVQLMQSFAVAFTRPTFDHVLTLMSGTVLASGRRTVTSALRAVGLMDERHHTTYHRVLNRAVWSPLQLSRILLGMIMDAFVTADQPLIIALDDTLERRFGRRTRGSTTMPCARVWAIPQPPLASSPVVSAQPGSFGCSGAGSRTVPLCSWGDSSFGVVELALTCQQATVTSRGTNADDSGLVCARPSSTQGQAWGQAKEGTAFAHAGAGAYKNGGAVFLAWDQGTSDPDGPIGMIGLSPGAKGHGYISAIHYTHSSTLRAFEKIYSVSPYLGGASSSNDLSDLFTSFP
jgi:hypothetical protein